MKFRLLLGCIVLTGSTLLTGCVVAPGPGGEPIAYVPPVTVAPDVGYSWRYHPEHGWGWWHPQRGWHQGWR